MKNHFKPIVDSKFLFFLDHICVRKFLPENKNLKLSGEEIAWLHDQAKSYDFPYSNMMVDFFSMQVDRTEFARALGTILENLNTAKPQIPARFKKAKLKELSDIHGGNIPTTNMLGEDIIGYAITNSTEQLIITRTDVELTSTTFRIYRFKKKMLIGEGYFQWPPNEMRLMYANQQSLGQKFIEKATRVYFSDKETALYVIKLFFPIDKYLTYKPQIVRAVELSELAFEEFAKHTKLIFTTQKLVEKVKKQKGQVKQISIGTHLHRIYIAILNPEIRRELAPYSVINNFIDGAELLIAIDVHAEGRLTLIDLNAMASGQLNAYRQTANDISSISHLWLLSEGLLYEMPNLNIDNLTDSIKLLSRELK